MKWVIRSLNGYWTGHNWHPDKRCAQALPQPDQEAKASKMTRDGVHAFLERAG